MHVVQDEKRMRGDRWENLQSLAILPCTNARELVFGPSTNWEMAFERARTSLVRFRASNSFIKTCERLLSASIDTCSARRKE